MATRWLRRVLLSAVALMVVLVSAEMISSYVLYRYYAHLQKDLRPEGSAVFMLLTGSIKKARGIHAHPKVTAEPGPLFDSDPALGFVMRPGTFSIKEELNHTVHYFQVTVDAEGNRLAALRPIHSSHRIFMTGDSGIFGWGLSDEQTLPWEIQEQLPGYEVVNLSLTSYSTIQTLLQLRATEPKLGPDDIVVVEYHPLTNQFNVAAPEVLDDLTTGYEVAVGTPAIRDARLPYGYLDPSGKLAIGHVSLKCAPDSVASDCTRRPFDMASAMKVTERTLDAIVALGPGHVVIAHMSGPDDDPVIDYAHSMGLAVADVRRDRGTPFDDDVTYTDGHYGPFFSLQLARRLVDILHEDHVIPDSMLSVSLVH
jgi:hypothetical protein